MKYLSEAFTKKPAAPSTVAGFFYVCWIRRTTLKRFISQ
jgi:hypothetical protein